MEGQYCRLLFACQRVRAWYAGRGKPLLTGTSGAKSCGPEFFRRVTLAGCGGCGGSRGSVVAGDGSQRDGQAIPRVDCCYHEREIDDLFFSEKCADLLVDRVRDMSFGDQSDGLGPCQGCALLIGVERRFAPGIELIEPLLRFAESAGVFRMHVDAVGASVDLRGAHFHEVDEIVLEA